MEPSFWTFQARDVVNIIILVLTGWAVYYGPIRAVKVSRQEEEKAAKERQKAQIFASLMKTRRLQLDAEHVAALNLIQVFFSEVQPVLGAYKSYIRLLNRQAVATMSPESIAQERDDAFVELVSEIAKSLGYQQDKRELESLGYSPQGWFDEQTTIRKLHTLMVELFEHRRALPITPVIHSSANNPFPPAPQASNPPAPSAQPGI